MSNTGGEDTKQNNYMRSWVKIVVGRLEEHSKTVAGVIVRMDLQNAAETIKDLEAESKQQEEVIRELIPAAERAKSGLWANDPYAEHIEEIIERAKQQIRSPKQ